MSALSTPVPHPLAERLIQRYRAEQRSGPVLEVAAGSGRNTRALVDAGLPVVSTRDDEPYTQLPGGRDAFAAAISTHGYLHGTTAKLRLGFGDLRRVLAPNGLVYITLGSINDPRFGFGLALDERTFAPGDGDEAGIPHAFFERDGIIELLRGFTIESMEEIDATTIVGTWAHPGLSGLPPEAANATSGLPPEAANATSGLPPEAANATDWPQPILHWQIVATKD